MSKRDFRTVNLTDGQMVESDKVIKRIGDLSYRDIGAFSKFLFSTEGIFVSSGLTISPVTGLQISIAEGKGIHGTDGANFPFLMTAAETLTLAAASGAARVDMIEMQVQSRAVKNDFSKAIIDTSTGEITTQSIKRDIQYFAKFQVKTGSTTPTAATAGVLTGTVSIASTVDLSTKYLLNICDGEDGEFIEVNIQGATPEATTKAEIVAKINAAIGRTMASISGNYIILSGGGTGVTSYFELKPPTSNSSLDALSATFGLSSSGVYNYQYRGTNAWVKICEIDMGAATTTLLSAMIRDVAKKETWASGGSLIRFTPNTNIGNTLLPLTITSADRTLTDDEANHEGFIVTGTLTANVNLVVPNTVRAYEIINNCAGAFTVTVKTSAGTGIDCGIGARKILFCDGTNVLECANEAYVTNAVTLKDVDVLATILAAFQSGTGARKLYFNIATGCTNIPTGEPFWAIEASGNTAIAVTARAHGSNIEYFCYYSSGAWSGWQQTRDASGNAIRARLLFNRPSSGTNSILNMALSDFATYGQGLYHYTIKANDPASPWTVDSHAVVMGYPNYARIIAFKLNSKAIAIRILNGGTWETAWTYLTDDNGNALGVNDSQSSRAIKCKCGTIALGEVTTASITFSAAFYSVCLGGIITNPSGAYVATPTTRGEGMYATGLAPSRTYNWIAWGY